MPLQHISIGGVLPVRKVHHSSSEVRGVLPRVRPTPAPPGEVRKGPAGVLVKGYKPCRSPESTWRGGEQGGPGAGAVAWTDPVPPDWAFSLYERGE